MTHTTVSSVVCSTRRRRCNLLMVASLSFTLCIIYGQSLHVYMDSVPSEDIWKFGNTSAINSSIDGSNWMSNLPSSVWDRTLNQLAIPGSHNSFTYTLDPTSDIGPDVSYLAKAFGSLARGVMFNWSVTQSQTISEQLESGIRFFDLRVALKPNSPDVVFLHGFYGTSVEKGFKEVNMFLEAHSKEVVILDFNRFYNVSEEYHTGLIDMIHRVFGSKLCGYIGVENVTLNMMWENGLQVIVLYNDEASVVDPILWPRDKSLQTRWANTHSVRKLVHQLNLYYLEEKGSELNVYQGVLAPDIGFIIGHLSGSIRTDLARKGISGFLSWVKDIPTGPIGVNICIADFTDISDSEFVKEVIKLNHW